MKADYIELSLEDECFIIEESPITLQDTIVSKNSIAEILSNLSMVIDNDKISKFNLSRNHIWEGAIRNMSRKSSHLIRYQ